MLRAGAARDVIDVVNADMLAAAARFLRTIIMEIILRRKEGRMYRISKNMVTLSNERISRYTTQKYTTRSKLQTRTISKTIAMAAIPPASIPSSSLTVSATGEVHAVGDSQSTEVTIFR